MGNTKKDRPLTIREERFVDAYLGPCAGNATAAVAAAGYLGRTAKSRSVTGSRLLGTVRIALAIKQRQAARVKHSILTAEERDVHLSKLAKQPGVPFATQVSAIKELNKCSGRHSIKHVMDVTEKLSDIIAASRAEE